MSKWGLVSKAGAIQQFKDAPDSAGQMVAEMSALIVDQDKEISKLKDELLKRLESEAAAEFRATQMEGYIKRVRELDPAGVQYIEKSAFQDMLERFRMEAEGLPGK